MLVETWNQVADWGIETIKNIQTHVGLGDKDGSNDECVPAPPPAVARHSSKPDHKEADKGGISLPLVALKAERDLLTKYVHTVDAVEGTGGHTHIDSSHFDHRSEAASNHTSPVASHHGSASASPVRHTVLRHPSPSADGHHRTPALRHPSPSSDMTRGKEALTNTGSFKLVSSSSLRQSFKIVSPTAPRRGSVASSPVRGSDCSSPVRHTSDIHHTPMGRRLSTEGSSSMLASPAASTPQGGGGRHLSASSRVRGAPSTHLAWGEEPPHRSPIRGNFE